MRKGDRMYKEESLVLKRPRFGDVNAYITLSLNGRVEVGEIQFGKPSKRQQRLEIYSQQQVERILDRRGLSNEVYSLAIGA